MDKCYIPEGYKAALSTRETQIAIKKVKDFFQRELATQLNLHRVTAPLFVTPESGLNDNLNGVERPVVFGIKERNDSPVEIVHSLAKWKRMALARYGFREGEGLYTDMNAIRRDEDTDNIHSIFVDQWDWEKVITKEQRTVETLKKTVKDVYEALRVTEKYIANQYDYVRQARSFPAGTRKGNTISWATAMIRKLRRSASSWKADIASASARSGQGWISCGKNSALPSPEKIWMRSSPSTIPANRILRT